MPKNAKFIIVIKSHIRTQSHPTMERLVPLCGTYILVNGHSMMTVQTSK